jgi:hypothetical protein
MDSPEDAGLQLLLNSDCGASLAMSAAPLTVTPATPLKPPVNEEEKEKQQEKEEEEEGQDDAAAALEVYLAGAEAETARMVGEARAGIWSQPTISLERVCQLCFHPGWLLLLPTNTAPCPRAAF